MISEKKFIIHYKNTKSSREFKIINGLQQGTVNSPTLFNLYTLDLLNHINNIISFADDIIIYHPDSMIEKINKSLQNKYNKVERYAINWHLKINTRKCETTLLRPPVNRCNHNVRTNLNKIIPNKFQN